MTAAARLDDVKARAKAFEAAQRDVLACAEIWQQVREEPRARQYAEDRLIAVVRLYAAARDELIREMGVAP